MANPSQTMYIRNPVTTGKGPKIKMWNEVFADCLKKELDGIKHNELYEVTHDATGTAARMMGVSSINQLQPVYKSQEEQYLDRGRVVDREVVETGGGKWHIEVYTLNGKKMVRIADPEGKMRSLEVKPAPGQVKN